MIDNGNLFSIWGWMKLGEHPKTVDIEIVRYSMMRNFPDEPLFELADQMATLRYLAKTKEFELSILFDDTRVETKVSEGKNSKKRTL